MTVVLWSLAAVTSAWFTKVVLSKFAGQMLLTLVVLVVVVV